MSHYTYLWEFRTSAEHRAEFERHYGAEGTWVALFRRATGFLGTTLLRDRADALKFVTIDRWRSAADYESFRERFGAEYAALDALCEGLTLSETLLGRFEEPGSGTPVPGGGSLEAKEESHGMRTAPTLYMVIERFRPGAATAIYRRVREHGRLLPPELEYLDSWVDLDRSRCFQLMRSAERALIDTWIEAWTDLVEFEVVAVQGSAEAARAGGADR